MILPSSWWFEWHFSPIFGTVGWPMFIILVVQPPTSLLLALEWSLAKAYRIKGCFLLWQMSWGWSQKTGRFQSLQPASVSPLSWLVTHWSLSFLQRNEKPWTACWSTSDSGPSGVLYDNKWGLTAGCAWNHAGFHGFSIIHQPYSLVTWCLEMIGSI